MLARFLILGAVIFFGSSTAAHATQRFVVPGGGNTLCESTDPCGLEHAVETVAVDGDEVLLADGTYNLAGATLSVSDAIVLRPQAAGTRPTITGTALRVLDITDAAQIRDVAIASSRPAAAFLATLAVNSAGATVERVAVSTMLTSGSASDSTNACLIVDGTLRDSTCLIRGGDALSGAGALVASPSATGTYSPRFVNVVAWSPDHNGFAIGAFALGSGIVVNATARNVIAQGASNDVAASNAPGGTASLGLSHSNYDSTFSSGGTSSITTAGTGTNITAPPLLVNPNGNDFHQQPGSPTINAGGTDALLGTQDLDFTPRIQGVAPDIGADEFGEGVLDVTAPETSITSAPRAKIKTKKKKVKFSVGFESNEASTFVCSLDGSTATACTSPFSGKVKKGKHTVTVTATDSAGNADASPASASWKVKSKPKKH